MLQDTPKPKNKKECCKSSIQSSCILNFEFCKMSITSKYIFNKNRIALSVLLFGPQHCGSDMII